MSGPSAEPSAYAVIGHPVQHSLSPLIHRQFAAESSISMTYNLLPAPADDFVAQAQSFFANGGCGLNVTLPFKEQAAQLVDYCDAPATLAGAVNTIRRDADGRLAGFNTDGLGLLQDLQRNLDWQIAGRRVLLIGAGGASRGALDALLGANPTELVLANRTLAKAQTLVAEVAPNDARVQVCSPADLQGSFDVVINATSASLAGRAALVPTDAVRGARCYDMLYAPQQTVFAGWAMSHGAHSVADGLGMLLEQAAAAFKLWHGVQPATQALLAQRSLLFTAQQQGAQSLEALWQAGDQPPVLAADSATVAAGAESPRTKRRFIAGAVCPECREIDRIVVRDTSAGGREQACVACGFSQPAPDSGGDSMVPRGKPERATITAAEDTPSQTVRFVEPAPSKQKAAPAKTPKKPD